MTSIKYSLWLAFVPAARWQFSIAFGTEAKTVIVLDMSCPKPQGSIPQNYHTIL